MPDNELPELVTLIVEDARARMELLVDDTRTRVEAQARALGAEVTTFVEDTRARVEAQARELGAEVATRVGELGTAVQASLIAVAVTMVGAMLGGLATAATLVELGLPWFAALWIVTALVGTGVFLLLRRAYRSGQRVIAPFVKS